MTLWTKAIAIIAMRSPYLLTTRTMLKDLTNIKLQVWDDSNLGVCIRVSHDVVGGSAITTSGVNLVDALQNLAIAIQTTNHKDEIWKDLLITSF